MSDEPIVTWEALSVIERRILGVLVEKQKTTDTYPLTLNALVTGSNQRSSREPILDLEPDQIEDALAALQKKGLVMRVISGRVDKWKHLLYDAWKVNSVELAVLTELLLRGPQTEGELRSRASRMDDIADLDALRQLLIPLKERGLIVYLTPENRRGTMLTHGFHDAAELAILRTHAASTPSEAPNAIPSSPTRNNIPDSQLTQISQTIADLSAELARVAGRLERIEKELGITSTPNS
jgi:uncharacterized protein YceH (UPF0502 family)